MLTKLCASVCFASVASVLTASQAFAQSYREYVIYPTPINIYANGISYYERPVDINPSQLKNTLQ